ncbi:MAG TPA: RsmD family RNA methyltransferase, partial [Anaerolineales bacterium]|nr:RsmD family RNA methyltransferase [Anaerolineales bacterium]
AAIRTIRRNLAETDLAARATVVQRDSFAYLQETPPAPFDYVYLAPPQYQGLWRKALVSLDGRPAWTGEDAWLIVQIDPREDEADLRLARLDRFDERVYGQTKLVFFRG